MSMKIPLNLYTFELPENQSCRYVLTSPRSLQACRQLNLRPVDLLPKTEMEIAEESPHLTSSERVIAMQHFEENRLKLLQAARNLRESLIKAKSPDNRIRAYEYLSYRQHTPLVDISEASKDEDDSNMSREEEELKSGCLSKSVSTKREEETQVDVTTSLDKRTKERQNQTLHFIQECGGKEEKFETEISEKELNGKKTPFQDFLRASNKYENTKQNIKPNESLFTQKKKPIRHKTYCLRPSSAHKPKTLNVISPDTTKIFSGRSPNTLSCSGESVTQSISPYLCSQYVGYKPLSPFKSRSPSSCAKRKVQKVNSFKGRSSSQQETNQPILTYHWGSAAAPRRNKATAGSASFRGSFLLRPSSASNKSQTKTFKPGKGKPSFQNASSTYAHSSHRIMYERSSPVPHRNRKCGSQSTSSLSLARTIRTSSDSESSPGRPPSSFRSEDVLRGRPKTRKLSSLSSNSSGRRHRRKSGTKRGTRKFPQYLNARANNLSRSDDILNAIPSRESSPSTASLPAQMAPRCLSATSSSSLSSISSLNSSVFSVSESRQTRKGQNVRSKLRPTFPSSYSSLPSRPTSSLAIPTYLRETSGEFSSKNVSTVRRSHSAKLPRSQKGFTSPLSLPLSLRRTTSTVSLADSQILSKFLNGVNKHIEVSVHDKRILELLALKHEKRFQGELAASQRQQQWKHERERDIKEDSRRWQEWQNQVNEKRRSENEENERRWRSIEEKFYQSQENLSALLRSKEKRSQELLQSHYRSKLRRLDEKRNVEKAKRAVVSAALEAKEEKQEMQRQYLLQLWERQQRLVEKRKREREELHKKRMGEMSCAAQERHKARQHQVQSEGAALLEAMRSSMEERMNRSEMNLRTIQQAKEESLRRSKEERSKQTTAVHALHDKLEADLLRWRQYILYRQIESSREAELRFTQNLQNKSVSVQEKLQQRQDHHKRLYQQVKERERNEEETARHLMATKDWRSEQVANEKQLRIQKAKTTALVTATLREDLRNKFSPETFDRKVARAKVEHRMENLPQGLHTNSRRSHIFLG